MKTLTIISRKSHLAQIQAEAVGKRILKYFPKIEIKFIQKDTQGDIDLNTPLHKMPEIGVFTNDIRNELIQKKNVNLIPIICHNELVIHLASLSNKGMDL